uniref:Uncharacterized protein n=1 Tax=Magallana gigas TaxID=29159 RepID=A0A8W8JKU6_MAGGI
MAALSNASLYVLLNVLLVIQTTVGGIPIRSGLYEGHDYLSLPNNAEPPCSCSPNNTQRRNETEDNYQPMQDDRRRLRADPPSIPDIEPMQDDSSRLMADPPSIPDIEMEDVLLEEIAPEDLDNGFNFMEVIRNYQQMDSEVERQDRLLFIR